MIDSNKAGVEVLIGNISIETMNGINQTKNPYSKTNLIDFISLLLIYLHVMILSDIFQNLLLLEVFCLFPAQLHVPLLLNTLLGFVDNYFSPSTI